MKEKVVKEGGPVPDQPRLLRVARAWQAAQDVMCYELADPRGLELPAWAPGAHIDLFLPAGLTRQYSLCGDPSESGWRIAVLLEPNGRGGSLYLHERVREGALVQTGAPRNNFPFTGASRYLFIAGGIGITPLLPMIAAADAAGADWMLHYGGRSRERMAFTGELAGYGGRCLMYPQDEYGLLPLDELTGPAADGAAIYCCGPEPLIDAVERAHQSRRSGSLHVERFRPRLSGGHVEDDSGFDVVLNSSGTVVRVAPGQSILAALTLAGIDVPSSCQEGTCASCETAVLDGAVDHRDSVLTDAERDAGRTMMLCVSRALSRRLVLDLLPEAAGDSGQGGPA